MSPSDKFKRLKILIRQENPITAGEDGEKAAEKWMVSRNWDFCKIEQHRWNLSDALKRAGAKRPDFIAEFENGKTVLALDAKHVSTENSTIFQLTDQELQKYRNLYDFLKRESADEIILVFMVIPKESLLSRMVFVELSEIERGEASSINGEPAKKICLTDRNGLWFDLPSWN